MVSNEELIDVLNTLVACPDKLAEIATLIKKYLETAYCNGIDHGYRDGSKVYTVNLNINLKGNGE